MNRAFLLFALLFAPPTRAADYVGVFPPSANSSHLLGSNFSTHKVLGSHFLISSSKRAFAAWTAKVPGVTWEVSRAFSHADFVTQDFSEAVASSTSAAMPWYLGAIASGSQSAAATIYLLDTTVFGAAAAYCGVLCDEAPAPRTHGTYLTALIQQVNPGATVVPVTVLNNAGWGSTWSLVHGLLYVLEQAPAGSAVVLALQGPYSQAVNNLVARIAGAGGTPVVAGGNDNTEGGVNACTDKSPSSAPGALVVGASDATGAPAPWSFNFSCLAVYAPGVGVNGRTGTSPATALVAAAASLVLDPCLGPFASEVLSVPALAGAACDFAYNATSSSSTSSSDAFAGQVSSPPPPPTPPGIVDGTAAFLLGNAVSPADMSPSPPDRSVAGQTTYTAAYQQYTLWPSLYLTPASTGITIALSVDFLSPYVAGQSVFACTYENYNFFLRTAGGVYWMFTDSTGVAILQNNILQVSQTNQSGNQYVGWHTTMTYVLTAGVPVMTVYRAGVAYSSTAQMLGGGTPPPDANYSCSFAGSPGTYADYRLLDFRIINGIAPQSLSGVLTPPPSPPPPPNPPAPPWRTI